MASASLIGNSVPTGRGNYVKLASADTVTVLRERLADADGPATVQATKARATALAGPDGPSVRRRSLSRALAVAEQTLQRLRGRIDPLDEAKLMLEMGAALKGLGRFGEAQSRLLEALQRFSGKLPLKHANAAFWLSVLALDQGELDDAERWAQVAADGSLQAGHRRGHAMSQWTIAEIALKRGEPARAIDLMEQAVAEARAIGSLSLQRELAGALVLRLEQLGRLDDAERWRREQASL